MNQKELGAIRTVIFCLVCICCTCACCSGRKHERHDAPRLDNFIFGLTNAIASGFDGEFPKRLAEYVGDFRLSTGRWPRDMEDFLSVFLKQHRREDLLHYRDLEFLPRQDGGMGVRYMSESGVRRVTIEIPEPPSESEKEKHK